MKCNGPCERRSQPKRMFPLLQDASAPRGYSRAAKLKRQKETAARNAFLDTQLAEPARRSPASVEKRARHAHGIEGRRNQQSVMKIRARQEYSELAEFHLRSSASLEKYAGALMAESRQELDLNGGPMETEYRALVAMEGSNPSRRGRSGILRSQLVRQNRLLEDRTVVEEKRRRCSATSGSRTGSARSV